MKPELTPPLALTQGDPNGIGPEIALKAWALRRERGVPAFVYYGDARALEAAARVSRIELRLTPSNRSPAGLKEAAARFDEALPIVEIERPWAGAEAMLHGQPKPSNGPAIIAAIDQAVADVIAGAASAVVTNPISKASLYETGFAHPGHTEYLAGLAQQHLGGALPHPVMMLACRDLKVVPLTIHVPIADVPRLVTRHLILATARVLNASIKTDFGIAKPRILVSGLNPHAGESGALGREEEDIIAPAVAALSAEGLDIAGPVSADTMFHERARRRYDAALTMYHDQALIPLKTIAFDEGVNVTLGLPFVRTSPDHGTAFDIAGRGIASPESLIAALILAREMVARRRAGAGS